MKLKLLLLCCLFWMAGTAQNLVTISPFSMPSNVPANTADWGSLTTLFVLATANGTPIPSSLADGNVAFTIKKGGSKVCGGTLQAAQFTARTKAYKANEISSMLGGCVLNPGTYQLCVQFFANTNGSLVPVSAEKCSNNEFVIESPTGGNPTGDTKYSPPQNLSPTDKKSLSDKEMTSPLTFRWTPLVPRPRDPILYRLKVWQLMQGQNGNAAMKSNTPVVTKEVKELTQFVKPNLMGDIEMIGGAANLVWNVEAVDGQGKVLGVSEPTVFNVSSCFPDVSIKLDSAICTKLTNGQMANTIFGKIKINATTGTTISSINFNNVVEYPSLINLPISGLSPATNSTNVGIENFTILIPNATCKKIRVEYIVNFNCLSGNQSVKCSDTITLPCCNIINDCCLQSKWEIVKMTNGSNVKTLPLTNSNIGAFKCKDSVKLKTCFICPPNCGTPKIQYEISNGFAVFSNYATSNCVETTLMLPSVSGNYVIKIEALCNGKICKTLLYEFKVECNPPTDCCKNATQKEIVIYDQSEVKLLTLSCSNYPIIKISDKLCNKDLIIKASANCGSQDTSCQSKTIISLKNSTLSVNISGTTILNIPSSLANGNYILTVTYYCGNQICKECKFEVIKDCPIEKDCCKGGYWGERLRIDEKGESSNLEKCGADLGLATCGYSGKFNITYKCDPNCKINAQIIYQFYNAITNLPVGAAVTVASGVTTTITNPSVSGTYYLSIKAKCGDKICDECKFYFKLNCPIETDCCKGGKWLSKKVFGGRSGSGEELPCGLVVKDTIPGGFQFVLNFDYEPNNKNCKTIIEYVFKDNVGNIVSSWTNIPGADQQITFPNTTGNYCLVVYAKSNGKICDSCKICFPIKENQSNDCCIRSSWKQEPIIYNSTGLIIAKEICKTPFTLIINNALKNCNETYTIKDGIFNCNLGSQNCISKVEYIIKNNLGTTLSSGINTLSFGPSLLDGVYNLKIYAWCGDKICDSCNVVIRKDCTIIDCCKNSSWGPKKWNEINVNCNTSLTPIFPINTTQVLNFTYKCNPQANCKAEIKYVIKNSFGIIISTSSALSGVDQSISTPNTAGTYCLTAYGICNGIVCDSCTVCFRVTCEDCNKVKISQELDSIVGSVCNLNGTINSPNTIAKVSVQLVSFSADRVSTSILYPVPNFEFTSTSTINGPTLLPFSLTGLRSNILISNFSTAITTIPYSLQVDNMNGKILRSYFIKFTMHFANGSYCEKLLPYGLD